MKDGEPVPRQAPSGNAWSGPGFRASALAGVLAVLALAGILTGFFVLFRPATDGAAEQARLAALQARADQNQAQVQALRGQLAASDADLAVERAARRTLEDSLAALQAQAGQLRDRLAFYDQLFPAGPAGTVSIRAVEIARVPAGLRYRVLLMRSARPGLAPFVGSLRFVATGMRDGAEVRVPLAPLQADPGPDSAAVAPTAPAQAAPADAGEAAAADGASAATGSSVLVPLEVGQYRSSEGILALPPDFTPTEVAVEVVQDGAVQTSQQAAVAF